METEWDSEWDRLEAIDKEQKALNNVVPISDGMPDWMNDMERYGEQEKPVEPLPGRALLSGWQEARAPIRRFIIPGWIVRGSAGLLSGLEGVGKSLLGQQMATCAAIGQPFLGLEIEHVPAAYISCEDDTDELWRRQEAINAALGITMEQLSGRLELVSLKGEIGNELATFDAGGRIIVQQRYHQIRNMCDEIKPGLVFLDNAAHFFSGNENARHDVAAFLGLLEQLSIHIDGAVILLAHPNKAFSQGSAAGNEYSGSTGWSAHVRNRLFLNYRADPKDGSLVDDDDRTLRKSKANYGKRGEEIHFRWHDWAFLEEVPAATVAAETRKTAEASTDNSIFLNCLEVRNRQQRGVSENKRAGNFAPKEFAEMVESRGIGRVRLEAAMDRLFRIGAIERGFLFTYKGEGKNAFGLRAVEGVSAPIGSAAIAPPIGKSNNINPIASKNDVFGKSNENKPIGSGDISDGSDRSAQYHDFSNDFNPIGGLDCGGNEPFGKSNDFNPITSENIPPPKGGEGAPLEGSPSPPAGELWGDDDPPIEDRDDDYTPMDWGVNDEGN